jgi:hypothetical protein
MADIAFQNAKDQIEQNIFETKTVIALNRKIRRRSLQQLRLNCIIV